MNTFTAVVNLTADVEDLKFGERDVKKLRVADNTFGKDNEARFFDVIVSSTLDMEMAGRLAKGDQIVVTGTLTRGSYKAKKTTKYAKKGEKVYTDSMPFGRILQVTKSPTFFNQSGEGEASDDTADTSAPNLNDVPPTGDEGADDPLDGVV
jgi:single-stranded DNA-binding protein